MAQSWVPTLHKRLLLAALDLVALAARPWLTGREARARDDGAVRAVLVVELWNIGDVVLMLPFLSQLRALFPQARISFLGRSHASILLAGTGLVDDFIEAELAWTDRLKKYNPFAYDWKAMFRLKKEMRARDFDVAFECRMHVREHVVLALSGSSRRVGYAFGNRGGLLTDALVLRDSERHKIQDWLQLLEPFGGPVAAPPSSLVVTDEERAWARAYLAERGISPGDVVVGIHPGASVADKRWPLERFHEVAAVLTARPELKTILFVDPAGFGASSAGIPGVLEARVGLRELMALIERCRLLVCNDSGPMHIAGGLGVPTVAIFGSGVERWYSPLGDGHRLIAADQSATNSGRRAQGHPLSVIPPQRVLAEVTRALAERAGQA